MGMFILMPITFFIAILMIAFEDRIGINKAAIAILSAISLWVMLLWGSSDILSSGLSSGFNTLMPEVPKASELPVEEAQIMFLSEFALINHLGDVATTLFFVISSLLIVNLVDVHGGFRVLTNFIHTHNKRRFMVIICMLTFFLSAVLDNIATAVLMVAILTKFIPEKSERWIFSSMVIISANAGGSWSPIGDVTTILLWTSGNLSPMHQISSLLLPSFITMVVPLMIASRIFFKKGESWDFGHRQIHIENSSIAEIGDKSRVIILVIGVLSLALVPVFNTLTHLPPFMGVLAGLGILWVYTDLMYKRMHVAEHSRLSISNIFHNLDMSTIMFFLGILMSVAALTVGGQLGVASTYLDETIHSSPIIAFILGAASSMLDNVALVAGAIGMYPLVDPATATEYTMNFIADGQFWTFLAYCCVTGGSMLIIGSATGVTVMGIEGISFGYYLKRFTLLAATGYLSGALVYLLLQSIM